MVMLPHMHLYPCVFSTIFLFIHPSTPQSIYLSIYSSNIYSLNKLSIHLSIYPSISIHPSINPSIHPSIRPNINQSIYLSIYLSIHLSVCHSYHLTNSFFTYHISVSTVSIHPYLHLSIYTFIPLELQSRFTILSNVRYGNISWLNISSGSFIKDSIRVLLNITGKSYFLRPKPAFPSSGILSVIKVLKLRSPVIKILKLRSPVLKKS